MISEWFEHFSNLHPESLFPSEFTKIYIGKRRISLVNGWGNEVSNPSGLQVGKVSKPFGNHVFLFRNQTMGCIRVSYRQNLRGNTANRSNPSQIKSNEIPDFHSEHLGSACRSADSSGLSPHWFSGDFFTYDPSKSSKLLKNVFLKVFCGQERTGYPCARARQPYSIETFQVLDFHYGAV